MEKLLDRPDATQSLFGKLVARTQKIARALLDAGLPHVANPPTRHQPTLGQFLPPEWLDSEYSENKLP